MRNGALILADKDKKKPYTFDYKNLVKPGTSNINGTVGSQENYERRDSGGINSGAPVKPKPQPKKTVSEIAIPTIDGKYIVEAPGWNEMSLEEKAKFRNEAIASANKHLKKTGVKASKPERPKVTLPSEAYQGAIQEGLDKVQNGLDSSASIVKQTLNPLSKLDELTGGKISGGLRSASKRSKILPMEELPDTGSVIGNFAQDALHIPNIVAGMFNIPSNALGGLADVTDPKKGALETAFGAANVLPALPVIGKAGKLIKGLKQDLKAPLSSGALDDFSPTVIKDNFDFTPKTVKAGLIPKSEVETIDFTPSNVKKGMEAKQRITIPGNKSTVTPIEPIPATTQKPPTPPKTPQNATSSNLGSNTTGISNRANLSEAEAGLLKSAPDPQGRSADAIYEANRKREDYMQIAEDAKNGLSISADDFATAIVGKQKLLQAQADARTRLETAIERGLDKDRIRKLQNDYDMARDTTQKYVEDLQKGKGAWSDVGRVLNLDVHVDTGNIESVLNEAYLRKGSKLTADEVTAYENLVKEKNTEITNLTKERDDLLLGAKERVSDTSIARRTPRTNVDIKASRQNAREEFEIARRKASGRTNALFVPGTDPDVLRAFGKYLKTFVDEGVTTMDDIVDAVKKDGFSAVERDDVIKAFGTPSVRKKSEILTDISKLRKEAKDELTKARKDATQGVTAKDVSTQNRLNKQKSDRQAKLTELQRQLDTGEFLEAQPKAARKVDEDIYRLNLKIKLAQSKVLTRIEEAKPKTTGEKINSFIANNALANPVARMFDVASNTTRMGAYLAGTPMRGAIDAMTSKVLGQPRLEYALTPERMARVLGRAKSRTGHDIMEIMQGGSVDTVRKYGQQTGIPSKAAGITDSPFKSTYYELGADWMAENKARVTLGKNASKADVADLRDVILREIDEHPDIQIAAHEFALRQTYNSDNWASMLGSTVKRSVLGNSPGAGAVYDTLMGRFSKVITNVAIDAMDRTGVGVVRGIAKLIFNKNKNGGLTHIQRLEVNEMIGKGLTGTAIMTTGYYMGKDAPGTLKEGRVPYVDFGDAEKVGGIVAPFLIGVAIKKISSSSLSASQKKMAIGATIARIPFNTPIASNANDVLDLINGSTSIEKYVAKKATNIVIPGGIRDTATRMDTKNGIVTGAEKSREKVKMINGKQSQKFKDIFIGEAKSKIPWLRQTLPSKDTKVKARKAELNIPKLPKLKIPKI